MSIEIKLPELGENIESADILNVLIKAGDKIEKEQALIEIETDKATVEVPSESSGIVEKVNVKPGDKIKTGEVIAILKDNDVKEDESRTEEKKDKPDKKEKEQVKEPEASEEKKDEAGEKQKEVKAEKKDNGKESPVSKDAKPNILEFKLPDLGENIESAEVISVLVKEGDVIKVDDGVVEIETDKATVEVPSNVSGKIKELLVKNGDKVKTGQVLLKVESSEVEKKEEKTPIKSEEKEPEEKEEKSREDKKVEEKHAEEETDGKRKIQPSETDEQPPIKTGAAPAAPSVRRLARELGIKISTVKGSGPSGRISMDDVKAHVKRKNEEQAKTPSAGFGIKAEKLPDFSKFGEIEKTPMSSIRSKTADHLSYAWTVIPHVTQHDKADITDLEETRKSLNPKFEKNGTKLTVTAILIKVIVAAIKEFPRFNSSIDMESKEIIFKKYFNIGIAVDTEHGLIVPILKNADQKSLMQLSIEMNELAEKARNKKISLDDLQGGSITITNLGGIGGTYFSPIVNSPEVAILGVSRGSYEPVYDKKNDSFEPRMMLPLSLSYDHRIIDGADAARFLRFVCEALENPLFII
jgi:pyruvate dehydrogenase E2 component (dihydrolipoamide acetyltransferase)